MKILCASFFLIIAASAFSQNNAPWKRPLKMAWSTNSAALTNATIFQDSAGVPCVIQWKGDTLICAFQWFRQPMNSASWDRVAVKFSFDAGITWSEPTPIIVTAIPVQYQR